MRCSLKLYGWLFFLLVAACQLHVAKAVAQEDSASPNDSPVADSLVQPQQGGDEVEYYDANYLRYENYIYRKNIKTPLLHPANNPLAHPIFLLGEMVEPLLLSFDDLDANVKYYYYTIIHCNADWTPSALRPNEYIEGFTEDVISDYQYSRNTLQQFLHYKLLLPNDNMQITKSGNYIVKVYLENNPDDVVLTQRFVVVDKKVKLEARVKQATTIADRNYKQEIDFEILPEDYLLSNPYSDMRVVVMQNFRWDNAISDLQPLFVKEDRLDYNYDGENVFPGGSEYRYFEITNLKLATESVYSIQYQAPSTHVYLYADERRTFKLYLYRHDINGRMLVRTTVGSDSETDADYAYVHFTLPYDEPVVHGNIYVFGGLSNWGFSDEFKMKYNYETMAYETAVYLKQGYYNYEYVLLEDGMSHADNAYVEGSHYETENEYYILVYHRSTGTNYDQLIALQTVSSNGL